MTVTPNKVLPAIEAVLAALQHSENCDDYLVRGSFVTRFIMGPYERQCQDLDLLYLPNWDRDQVANRIQELVSTNEMPATLIRFEVESLQIRDIWEHSLSPGLRAQVNFEFGGEMQELQIDVAGNDPLVAAPVELEVPVGEAGRELAVKTVVPEILAAWKLHGLFEHLSGAWMTKTLWDLYLLCRYNSLDPALFRKAIDVAFNSRLDPPVIVRRLLYGDFGRSSSSIRGWENEITQYTGGEIVAMSAVLSWLRDYLVPIIEIEDDGTLSSNADVVSYRVKRLRERGDEAAIMKLATLSRKTRILPHKAYYAIPHLPGSRKTGADRDTTDNKAAMLTRVKRHPDDVVIVREKLDGSCVCVLRQGDEILALGRHGDLAADSPNESRRLWSEWVLPHEARFKAMLQDGERVCGEWLALVHGTRYRLQHEPFVVFDIFDADNHMLPQAELESRCAENRFVMPHKLHEGEPVSIETIAGKLEAGCHGAVDQPEGAVWRLERNGRPLFLAKYVYPDKMDGCYLPENSGQPALWNWHPVAKPWFE